MRRIRESILLSMTLVIALLVPIVSAHGFDNTQEQIIDGYRFEFGATNLTPVAGERVGMSFSIDNVSADTTIPVDGLWVRVSQGNDIYFSSSDLRTTNTSITSMDLIFPKAGTYDIDVEGRFPTEKRATFHITVQDRSANEPPQYVWIGIALAFGIILGLLLTGQRRTSNT